MEPCTKQDDIEHIKRSVQRIESALLGDEYNKDGLLKRMDKLEKKQENTDRKIVIFSSLASGFTMAIGFIFKVIRL